MDPWTLPQGPAPEPSLVEINQQWPELWHGYRRWIEEMSETDLSAEIITILPGDVGFHAPRWKILRHVLEHSQFHRGQVVGMIRSLGHCPPAINRMDFYI